ncbi:hypothetical protein EHI8A_000420 [Entamoeba histolytica HM-1:IMSS-B]|uniref:Uncharacterized protein n=6 Tax=Entamoeba histolytica TaxID=5759 RepID=C4LYM1_ENTH1|nr:hypothetical protein EHI_118730 [Entamoeba histolytica HM-1:IMSS]EMD48270.1 Hypothetical protein EHI5A_002080 [Entamoeba histolytica KU27]EMH72455.1 hypothetical protein EHI8A_000420 [Entamoeba histolytica HM-1:IMSS-B]EMS15013.1 hypothetical protein KM1_001010 [Entamoeba histolytica HM-3:IMSS]ENY60685.1 hypothetical protein EHI7A_001080 [Entamoeba histolytica HM-1:IMSS-A]GAT93927.1 hypothetical protein CL6EHI_118730 [Entamoeba histolytica]|eukprot:XP_654124.1 hypothetical protein EHI_118730 [Entamoeba histolytica HM-1:IMSS]
MFLLYFIKRLCFIISLIIVIGYIALIIFISYFGFIQSLFLKSEWILEGINDNNSLLQFVFTTPGNYRININSLSMEIFIGNMLIGNGIMTDFTIKQTNKIEIPFYDIQYEDLLTSLPSLSVYLNSFKVSCFSFKLEENVYSLKQKIEI